MSNIEKLLNAPCICCGYNGRGYWQKETHDYYCPFYEVGGVLDRIEKVRKILTGFRETKIPRTYSREAWIKPPAVCCSCRTIEQPASRGQKSSS